MIIQLLVVFYMLISNMFKKTERTYSNSDTTITVLVLLLQY